MGQRGDRETTVVGRQREGLQEMPAQAKAREAGVTLITLLESGEQGVLQHPPGPPSRCLQHIQQTHTGLCVFISAAPQPPAVAVPAVLLAPSHSLHAWPCRPQRL
jgi:hypothetical protein